MIKEHPVSVNRAWLTGEKKTKEKKKKERQSPYSSWLRRCQLLVSTWLPLVFLCIWGGQESNGCKSQCWSPAGQNRLVKRMNLELPGLLGGWGRWWFSWGTVWLLLNLSQVLGAGLEEEGDGWEAPGFDESPESADIMSQRNWDTQRWQKKSIVNILFYNLFTIYEMSEIQKACHNSREMYLKTWEGDVFEDLGWRQMCGSQASSRQKVWTATRPLSWRACLDSQSDGGSWQGGSGSPVPCPSNAPWELWVEAKTQ